MDECPQGGGPEQVGVTVHKSVGQYHNIFRFVSQQKKRILRYAVPALIILAAWLMVFPILRLMWFIYTP